MASLLWTLATLHLLSAMLVLSIDQSNADTKPFNLTSWCHQQCPDNSDLCVSSLGSDPRTFLAGAQLSNISIDISLANATSTHSEINNARNNSTSDPGGWLATCLQYFDMAINGTQSAAHKFQPGTLPNDLFHEILNDLGHAEQLIYDCGLDLTNHGVPMPELIQRVEMSRRLSNVAYEIFLFTHNDCC